MFCYYFWRDACIGLHVDVDGLYLQFGNIVHFYLNNCSDTTKHAYSRF